MENIFHPTEAAAIISRLEKVEPQSKALWGKMSAAQMLAHIQIQVEVAVGTRTIKRNIFGVLFGKMAKKSLMKDKPFSKNLPTHPTFIIKDSPDFYKEKNAALHLMHTLINNGTEGLSKLPHPFFGKMTDDEWGILVWKHMDHHLRQFGL